MIALETWLNNYPYKITLGSASPRRQELLKSLGFKFDVKVLKVEEVWPLELKAQDIALYLAQLKAGAYKNFSENELLITADTIVWCDGKIFNKPADFNEGVQMLNELSGRMHQVFTAVCLKSASKQVVFYDESKVYFKKLSSDEIEYYLKNYHPYDKAGGYGVQEWIGYIAIEKIEGSFYTVMGLPVRELYERLLTF